MRFTQDFIPTILALALSITHAEAGVAVGTAAGYNVMWPDGNDFRRWTAINNVGQNPCGISRNLDNGYSYILQGCGGNLWLDNGDGSFNSNCWSAPADLGSGVHRQYICS